MAQQQANYAAKAAEANAAAANQQGYARAGEVYTQYDDVRATQRAQLAASGVDVASGSAGALALETAKRGAQAAATQIWQGRSEATAYKNQASAYKAQGKADLVGGIIGGVGSILGGVANIGSLGGLGGGTPSAAPGPLSLGTAAPPVVGTPQTYTGPKKLLPLGPYPGGYRYPGGRITF